MRLKQRIEDFRVRELLREAPGQARQHYRVYRVTKKKMTSMEAARRLAQEVDVAPGEVSMAGLKDRQGVTIQHMAVHHGPPVSVKEPEIRIESVGYREDALTPAASEGNAFEVVVRGLDAEQLAELRANMPLIRDGGVVNYFDDQRFGNLRHGQGWIALDLMRGEPERALRALLTSTSFGDDPRRRAFKRALAANWGDWRECRDVAGRFGEHHSVFEHLKREPEDFVGAFQHIATRLRLIHLYAFQSHIWNRAVADLVRSKTPLEQRVIVKSLEGPLVFPETAAAFAEGATFRLPGAGLEDVQDEEQRGLLEDALATERLVAASFDIQGIPGFGLKGEDRPLIVRPQHIRVRPAEPDALNQGLRMVRVRFELPRGAYATLVVRRLLGRRVEGGAFQQDRALELSARRPESGDRAGRPGGWRGPREHGEERDSRADGRGDHGRQRSFGSGGHRGHDGRGSRGDRYEDRRGRAQEPGSRDPIQTSARPGAWRPGHGLSGDEPKDRDRAQAGGERGERRPRREFGDDRGRGRGQGGEYRRPGHREGRGEGSRGGRPGGGGRPYGGRSDRTWDDRGASRGGSGGPGAYRGRDDRRGHGGHSGHEGAGRRPWQDDRSIADPGGSASDDSNWGAREDARNAERGPSREGREDRDRGGYGGRGSRPFGRRPDGGRDERRPDRHPDRRPDRHSDRRPEGRPERGAPRGHGRSEGNRGWAGPGRGGRDERPSRGSSQGGRSEWRSPQREGGRPRHDHSAGGGRPRQDRGSSSWGGERPRQDRDSSNRGGERSRPDRGSSSWSGGRPGEARGPSKWGAGRPRQERGSAQRGDSGGRPGPGGKPGGWGAKRARHEHKPRGQGSKPSRYDQGPKREQEQERNPDA